MMRRNGFRMAPASQRGVGLIEVLVAVLVLSVGFLGMAAMQARSLSMNNSAMARNVATMETYSILDGMRADLVAAQSGAYGADNPITASACPSATGTLADTQLTQWCQQLGANLGASATGTITCTGTLGVCTVTVTYDDSTSRSTTTDSSTQTVTTQAML
jgi:type IV pilus assembly protein PilV